MSYSTNKYMPRIRRDAARLVFKGWSARKVGRYFGFHHTAVLRWVFEARKVGDVPILTRSSEPKTKPRKISKDLEEKIVSLRRKTRRCTEAIHLMLKHEGSGCLEARFIGYSTELGVSRNVARANASIRM